MAELAMQYDDRVELREVADRTFPAGPCGVNGISRGLPRPYPDRG